MAFKPMQGNTNENGGKKSKRDLQGQQFYDALTPTQQDQYKPVFNRALGSGLRGQDAMEVARQHMLTLPDLDEPEVETPAPAKPQMQSPRTGFTIPSLNPNTGKWSGQQVQDFFGLFNRKPESQVTDADRAAAAYQPSGLTGTAYFDSLTPERKEIYRPLFNDALGSGMSATEAMNAAQARMEADDQQSASAARRKILMEEAMPDVNNAMGVDHFNSMDEQDQDTVLNAWEAGGKDYGISSVLEALKGIDTQGKYGWSLTAAGQQDQQQRPFTFAGKKKEPTQDDEEEISIDFSEGAIDPRFQVKPEEQNQAAPVTDEQAETAEPAAKTHRSLAEIDADINRAEYKMYAYANEYYETNSTQAWIGREEAKMELANLQTERREALEANQRLVEQIGNPFDAVPEYGPGQEMLQGAGQVALYKFSEGWNGLFAAIAKGERYTARMIEDALGSGHGVSQFLSKSEQFWDERVAGAQAMANAGTGKMKDAVSDALLLFLEDYEAEKIDKDARGAVQWISDYILGGTFKNTGYMGPGFILDVLTGGAFSGYNLAAAGTEAAAAWGGRGLISQFTSGVQAAMSHPGFGATYAGEYFSELAEMIDKGENPSATDMVWIAGGAYLSALIEYGGDDVASGFQRLLEKDVRGGLVKDMLRTSGEEIIEENTQTFVMNVAMNCSSVVQTGKTKFKLYSDKPGEALFNLAEIWETSWQTAISTGGMTGMHYVAGTLRNGIVKANTGEELTPDEREALEQWTNYINGQAEAAEGQAAFEESVNDPNAHTVTAVDAEAFAALNQQADQEQAQAETEAPVAADNGPMVTEQGQFDFSQMSPELLRSFASTVRNNPNEYNQRPEMLRALNDALRANGMEELQQDLVQDGQFNYQAMTPEQLSAFANDVRHHPEEYTPEQLAALNDALRAQGIPEVDLHREWALDTAPIDRSTPEAPAEQPAAEVPAQPEAAEAQPAAETEAQRQARQENQAAIHDMATQLLTGQGDPNSLINQLRMRDIAAASDEDLDVMHDYVAQHGDTDPAFALRVNSEWEDRGLRDESKVPSEAEYENAIAMQADEEARRSLNVSRATHGAPSRQLRTRGLPTRRQTEGGDEGIRQALALLGADPQPAATAAQQEAEAREGMTTAEIVEAESKPLSQWDDQLLERTARALEDTGADPDLLRAIQDEIQSRQQNAGGGAIQMATRPQQPAQQTQEPQAASEAQAQEEPTQEEPDFTDMTSAQVDQWLDEQAKKGGDAVLPSFEPYKGSPYIQDMTAQELRAAARQAIGQKQLYDRTNRSRNQGPWDFDVRRSAIYQKRLDEALEDYRDEMDAYQRPVTAEDEQKFSEQFYEEEKARLEEHRALNAETPRPEDQEAPADEQQEETPQPGFPGMLEATERTPVGTLINSLEEDPENDEYFLHELEQQDLKQANLVELRQLQAILDGRREARARLRQQLNQALAEKEEQERFVPTGDHEALERQERPQGETELEREKRLSQRAEEDNQRPQGTEEQPKGTVKEAPENAEEDQRQGTAQENKEGNHGPDSEESEPVSEIPKEQDADEDEGKKYSAVQDTTVRGGTPEQPKGEALEARENAEEDQSRGTPQENKEGSRGAEAEESEPVSEIPENQEADTDEGKKYSTVQDQTVRGGTPVQPTGTVQPDENRATPVNEPASGQERRTGHVGGSGEPENRNAPEVEHEGAMKPGQELNDHPRPQEPVVTPGEEPTPEEPVVNPEETPVNPDEPTPQDETVTPGETPTNPETELTEEDTQLRDENAKKYNFKVNKTQGDGSNDAGVHLTGSGRNVSSAGWVTLQVADRLGKQFGFSVEVGSDIRQDADGKYDGGRTIYINEDAKNPLEQVIGHELYHMVKRISPANAQRIERIFDRWAAETGFDTARAVEARIAKYDKAGVTLDKLAAKEEVIANSMYTFLADENTIRQVYNTDQHLFSRIMDFVNQVQQSIREMLRRYERNTPEARALSRDQKTLAKLNRAMLEALTEMKALDPVKKAATEYQVGNSTTKARHEMTRAYSERMKNATNRAEMNAAARDMAGKIAAKAGGKGTTETDVLNAAAAVGIAGVTPYEAMKNAGLAYDTNDVETKDALRLLGNYMAAVERSGDTEWLTGLLTGEEEENQDSKKKYSLFGLNVVPTEKGTLIRQRYTDEEINASVRLQVLEHYDELNAMIPVADVSSNQDLSRYYVHQKSNRFSALVGKANEIFEKLNWKIERKGFPTVYVTKKGLTGNGHNNNTELMLFEAVPSVIENGMIINKHDIHKGTYAPSTTFSAPINMDGAPLGFMSVVVRQKNKQERYYLHEVILPNGDRYVFNNTKAGGGTQYHGSGVMPKASWSTPSASKLSIPQTADDVNEKLSIPAMDNMDEEYMAAVESGDEQKQQELADQAAKGAGFDTPRLFHGTGAFGFTEFDLEKGEQLIFATSDRKVAETYSGKTGRSRISERTHINVDDLHGEKLLEAAKKHLQKYSDYHLMTADEKGEEFAPIRAGLKEDWQLARDFVEENKDAFNEKKKQLAEGLVKALEDLYNARTEEEIDSAWGRWDNGLWDLKWMDESICDELMQAVGTHHLLTYKNLLSDMMYDGDMYINAAGEHVFDNQLALELEAELHKGVYELYGRSGRQLVLDGKGKNWNQIEAPEELHLYGPQKTRDIAAAAKAYGYDSVLIKNIYDLADYGYRAASDIYIFFSAEQVKSADPVTYDDQGNVIPLTERFNQASDDIRYSLPTADEDFDFSSGDEDPADAGEWDYHENVARAGKSKQAYDLLLTLRETKHREKEEQYGNWRQHIGEMARTLVEETGSQAYSQQAVEKELNEIFEAYEQRDGASREDADQAVNEALDMLQELVGRMLVDQVYTDEVKAVRSWMRKGIYLDEEQAKELGGKEERRYFRQVVGVPVYYDRNKAIKAKAVHLDGGSWAELNQMAPSAFPMDDDPMAGSYLDRPRLLQEYLMEHESMTVRNDPQLRDFVASYALETLADYYSRSDEGDATSRLREANRKANSKAASLERQLKNSMDEVKKLTEANQELDRRWRNADTETWKAENQLRRAQAENEQLKAQQGTTRPEIRAEREQLQKDLQAALTQQQETAKALTAAQKEQKRLMDQLERVDERASHLDSTLKAVRKENDQKMKQAIREGKQRWKKQAEQRAENQVNRQNIRKLETRMKKMLEKPSNTGYVPFDKIRKLLDLVEAVQQADTRKTARATESWMRAVREMREETNSLVKDAYDDGFIRQMQEAADILNDKRLRDLNGEELRFVSNTMTQALYQIENATKLVGEDRKADALEEAQNMTETFNAHKPQATGGLAKGLQSLATEHLNPESEFNKLAGYRTDNAVYRRGQALIKGQREMNKIKMEMTKRFEPLMTGKNAKLFERFQGKKAEIIDTGIAGSRHGTFKITQSTRAAIYLHSLNKQNVDGMKNGVTVPDYELMKKGKYREAWDRAERMLLTERDMREITAGMTEYEKAWCKAWKEMQAYITPILNDVSMKLNGWHRFTVENYFPIRRDGNYLATDFESLMSDDRISSMGFAKLRKNASNPMMLEDLYSVVNRTINGSSLYAGMLIPVTNFNKVFNASLPGYEDSPKAALRRVFGNKEYEYIERMMKDVQQAGVRTDSSLLDKVRSKAAPAALGANLSVIIKQAASYPTAAAVLGWRPLMRAMSSTRKFDQSIVDKYTSAYWERTSANIQAMNANTQNNTIDKTSSWLNAPIAGMDKATVRKIWIACEYAVEEQQPGLARGSDAYYEAVAELYEHCLERTQPEYGVMQRSHILRSNNQLTKSLTMYKTQSFQNFNVLYDAVQDLRTQAKAFKSSQSEENRAELDRAKTKLARAASSQIVSAVVLALMTAVGKAVLHKPEPYQDDKGELTAQSAAAQLSKDAISSMMGMVTGGSELFDLITGIIDGKAPYDIEAGAVSMVNDLYQSAYKLGVAATAIADSSLTTEQKWQKSQKAVESFLSSVAAMGGIPYNNLKNISNSAIKYVDDIRSGKGLEGLTTGDVSLSTGARYMAQALQSGDQETYTRLYNRLISQGKSGSQINSAIKSWVKANDPRIREAADAIDQGDLNTYNSLINQMVGDGYGMAMVVSAIEAVRKASAGEEAAAGEEMGGDQLTYEQIMAAQENESASAYTYAQLNSLLEAGNTSGARKVQSALFKSKGTTGVKSALTSYWKPKYQEAYQKRNRTELNRITRLMKAMGYSDASIAKWKNVQADGGSTTKKSKSKFGGSFGSGFSSKKFGK